MAALSNGRRITGKLVIVIDLYQLLHPLLFDAARSLDYGSWQQMPTEDVAMNAPIPAAELGHQ